MTSILFHSEEHFNILFGASRPRRWFSYLGTQAEPSHWEWWGVVALKWWQMSCFPLEDGKVRLGFPASWSSCNAYVIKFFIVLLAEEGTETCFKCGSVSWPVPPLLCNSQLWYHCNPETKELEVLRIVICINVVILFYRGSSGNVQKDKEFANAGNGDRSGSKSLPWLRQTWTAGTQTGFLTCTLQEF